MHTGEGSRPLTDMGSVEMRVHIADNDDTPQCKCALLSQALPQCTHVLIAVFLGHHSDPDLPLHSSHSDLYAQSFCANALFE